MTLALAAVRHASEVFATPVATRLSGATCSIGRGRTCDVVLEDPTKHVSRLHATISREGGRYVLRVESAVNPVVLNGTPVTKGQEAQLRAGDVLIIGEYELRVQDDAGGGPAGMPPAGAAAAPAGAGGFDLDSIFGAGSDDRRPAAGRKDLDALLGPSGGAAPAADPLASLLSDAGSARPSSRPVEPSEDPLLGLLGGSGGGRSAPVTPADDIGRALGGPGPGVSSIDDLLGGAAASDPLGLGLNEPDRTARPGFGGSGRGASLELDHVHDVNLPMSLPEPAPLPPGRPAAQRKPAPAPTDDPLAALFAEAPPAAPARPGPVPGDDPLAALIGDTPTAVPAPVRPGPGARARAASPPTDDPLAALLADAGPTPATESPAPTAGRPAAEDSLSALLASAPVPAPAEAPTKVSPPTRDFVETTVFSVDEEVPTGRSPYLSPDELRAAGPDSASLGKALQAFLEGAGMPKVSIPDDQAEAFMKECGETVRAAVEGIMGMLLARAKMREELRASDRTMVASRENNAFKLFESVDEALTFVLDPSTRTDAFMPPPKAIGDACNDLQAHEIGLVAGMRAALMGSIKRFEPGLIEKKLEKEGGASLLANKKARLWDRYVTYHDDTQKEAEDNFDRVFGADFLRAYHEQVRRLRK